MMKPKRILIATPLKGDIPKSYFRTSLRLATAKIPDVQLDWCLLDGPVVQQARNELVEHALKHKFDEVVFWDKDVLLESAGEDLTSGAFMRLISHDKDMVCGIYSTRSAKTHWHMHLIPGEQPDDAGLQKVERCAIGFCKIKTDVFRKIAKDNPWRTAVLFDPNSEPRNVTEFFPMGLKGPGTPEERLKSIKEAISEPAKSHEIVVRRIERLIDVKYDQPNVFISEDYWFCDLVRASGFDIHMDTRLILGHTGKVTLPLETPLLFQMLSEPWRKEEIKAIRTELTKSQTPPEPKIVA